MLSTCEKCGSALPVLCRYCDLERQRDDLARLVEELQRALDGRGHGCDEKGRCRRCGVKVVSNG